MACLYTHAEIWSSETAWIVKDDTWCQTLGQFIGVHYLNLNPNKQFQKKPKQRRVEEMETPEVLKKEYVKIPGVN